MNKEWKHAGIGALLILAVGIMGLYYGVGTLAQGSDSGQNNNGFDSLIQKDPIPPEVSRDKILVIKPGVIISPFLTKMNKPENAGMGIIGYTKTGKLFVIVRTGNTTEAYVYQYKPNSNRFQEVDCDKDYRDLSNDLFIYPAPTEATMDSFIGENCRGLNLDLERSGYSYTSDLYTFGEQYMNQSLKLGDSVIRTMIKEGEAGSNQFIGKGGTEVSQITTPEKISCPSNPNPNNIMVNDAWESTITNFPNEVAPQDPYCIQFNNANKNKYLLKIWEFDKTNKDLGWQGDIDIRTIGMELYFWDQGTWSEIWSNLNYSNRIEIVNNKVESKTESISPNEMAIVRVSPEVKNVVFNSSIQGNVTVTYTTSNDKITKVVLNAVDHAKFANRDQYLFWLGDDTIGKIRDALENPSYDIYSDSTKKAEVKIENSKGAELTLLPKKTSDLVPFFRVDESVAPGKYLFTLKVQGYKDIIMEGTLDYEDLSDGKSFNDIRIVDFKGELIKDPCNSCSDLTTCLACVDNAIVTKYQ